MDRVQSVPNIFRNIKHDTLSENGQHVTDMKKRSKTVNPRALRNFSLSNILKNSQNDAYKVVEVTRKKRFGMGIENVPELKFSLLNQIKPDISTIENRPYTLSQENVSNYQITDNVPKQDLPTTEKLPSLRYPDVIASMTVKPILVTPTILSDLFRNLVSDQALLDKLMSSIGSSQESTIANSISVDKIINYTFTLRHDDFNTPANTNQFAKDMFQKRLVKEF